MALEAKEKQLAFIPPTINNWNTSFMDLFDTHVSIFRLLITTYYTQYKHNNITLMRILFALPIDALCLAPQSGQFGVF